MKAVLGRHFEARWRRAAPAVAALFAAAAVPVRAQDLPNIPTPHCHCTQWTTVMGQDGKPHQMCVHQECN